MKSGEVGSQASPQPPDSVTEGRIHEQHEETREGFASPRMGIDEPEDDSDERSPLLHNDDREDGSEQQEAAEAGEDLRRPARNDEDVEAGTAGAFGTRKGRSKIRWPSLLALATLSIAIIAILTAGFAAPAVMKEYAEEAVTVHPKDIQVESLSSDGVRSRVRADVGLDARQVRRASIRGFSRLGTAIFRSVTINPSRVKLYLPDYQATCIGLAKVPRLRIGLSDHTTTKLDFVSDFEPGDLRNLPEIGKSWIANELKNLTVLGQATLSFKTGILRLGSHMIEHAYILDASRLPNNSDIVNLDANLKERNGSVIASASADIANPYPVALAVPPLSFDVQVPQCSEHDFFTIMSVQTESLDVKPKQNVHLHVSGVINKIAANLTTTCPTESQSPLDRALSKYMEGISPTLFIQGSSYQEHRVPPWIAEILSNTTVPFKVPARDSHQELIRNFTFADVHLGLPNPFSQPDSPAAKPRISAKVQVLVALPSGIDFSIDVVGVRADAEVYHEHQKLGNLDLREWQKASTYPVMGSGVSLSELNVTATIQDAPLNVTDDDVLSDVIEALMFGAEDIELQVKASVDVNTSSPLGSFVIRDIPASGTVPIKPLKGDAANLGLEANNLRIRETSSSSLVLAASINLTNPTAYSALVPYFDVRLLVNDTLVGHAAVRDVQILPGRNIDIPVTATWEPTEQARGQGREMISQYISGYNVSMTLRSYRDSIPNLPHLGTALSRFQIDVPIPKLHMPRNPKHPNRDDDGDDNRLDQPNTPQFIDDSTFHVLSSTAAFTMLSPLPSSTILITKIDASAYYNHTLPVGKIVTDTSFQVPPGVSNSPRLPVQWSVGSLGYRAVVDAIGGRLRLDAKARVGLQIGFWQEEIWYEGHGLGAKIRI